MGINRLHARRYQGERGFSLEPWQVDEVLESHSANERVRLERIYLNALYYFANNPNSHSGRKIMARIAMEDANFGAPQWDKDSLNETNPLYHAKRKFDKRHPEFDYGSAANLFRDIYYTLNCN